MSFTNTKYINPDAAGGGDGTSGDPYNWADIRGSFASDTEYLVLQGSTTVIGADSATGWIDFSGLTNVKLGIWPNGGTTRPLFTALKDLGALSWTDNGGSVANTWYVSHTSTSVGGSNDRVFFDTGSGPVGQARAGTIARLNGTYRCYKTGSLIYVYSTGDPGTSGGEIDGVATGVYTLYDVELFNLDGADQIFIEDIDLHWVSELFNYTLTADLSQLEVTNVDVLYPVMNGTPLQIFADAGNLYLMKGIVLDNVKIDCVLQPYERGEEGYEIVDGSSNGVQLRYRVGESSGGVPGDGLWVKNSTFIDQGHTGVQAGAIGVSAPFTPYWTRSVLIEDCIFEAVNTNLMHPFALYQANAKDNIVRNCYIKGCPSSCSIGTSDSEYYNLVFDSPGKTFSKDTGIDGGPLELYTHEDYGGIVANNYLHSITIYNSYYAAISWHSGAMQGGTGNKYENILIVNTRLNNDWYASLDGFAIIDYGSYTSNQLVTYNKIVIYDTTLANDYSTDPFIYIKNSSEIQTTYGLSDIGTDPLTHFSNFIVTNPELNTTTWNITNTGSAYNAGADLSASSIFNEVNFDYYHNPRPNNGSYDIGAVEYGLVDMPVTHYSLRRKIEV